MTAPATEKAAQMPAEERLWWFLFVLNACGSHGSYANDEPGEWVAAFCDDAEPTDTFNRACDLKLATCTHNSMDETSRIWITEAGKRFLADRSSQEERYDAFVLKPQPSYTHAEVEGLLNECSIRFRKAHLEHVLRDRASQEERIREDERDRLYGKANANYIEAEERGDSIAQDLHSSAAFWLGENGGMPAEQRARLRGGAS